MLINDIVDSQEDVIAKLIQATERLFNAARDIQFVARSGACLIEICAQTLLCFFRCACYEYLRLRDIQTKVNKDTK